MPRNDGPISDEARLTLAAGEGLKELRERNGLSQAQLCAELGIKNRFAVSMIETGRNHLSPAHYAAYAAALGIDAREFVKTLMSFYSPLMYELLLKDE